MQLNSRGEGGELGDRSGVQFYIDAYLVGRLGREGSRVPGSVRSAKKKMFKRT